MVSPARILCGATVLTCDSNIPDLISGDVLIRDGRIEAVGKHLPIDDTTETVDAAGTVIFPGLIDAHQHLWEGPYLLQQPNMHMNGYFSEFVSGAAGAVTAEGLHYTVSAALKASVTAGTTTTFDWCHVTNSPEHADASLAAAVESPSRYVFGYGPPVALGYYNNPRGHPADMERLANSWRAAPDRGRLSGRVSIAAALRGPDLSKPDTVRSDIDRARSAGLRISMHVSTQRAGPGGVTALHRAGLLGPDLQFVHLTDATADELAMIADSDGRVVVPPIAELSMGAGFPPLRRMADAGVPVALAVDSVLGSPPDMFTQMRAAAGLLRAGGWQGGCPPTQSCASEVLASATINGARACWLDDVIGSLTPGKWADLVVFRPSRPVSTLDEAFAQVVWMGHPSRLESVLIGGVEALTVT